MNSNINRTGQIGFLWVLAAGWPHPRATGAENPILCRNVAILKKAFQDAARHLGENATRAAAGPVVVHPVSQTYATNEVKEALNDR